MAVLQMQRLSICAMKKDRKAILEELQRLGVMEIENSVTEDEALQRMNTLEACQAFDKNAQLADHALEVLQEYAPEKSSMFSSLEGKALLGKAEYDKVAQEKETIIKTAKELVSLQKQIAEKKAELVKRETKIEALAPWMDLDVPMNYMGTEKTELLIGAMANPLTLEEVYAAVAKANPELEAFDVQIVSTDKDQTCLAVTCMRQDTAKVEEALRSIGFARPTLTVRMTPKEEKARQEKKIQAVKESTQKLEDQIRQMASSRDDLKMIADYFRMRAQKYEILGNLRQSKQTFFISGYVPARTVSALEQKLNKEFDAMIDIEDLKEDEEPPVLLQNNKFSSSVEGVLEAYGLPQKGEVDPTAVMSFFYVVFFGLMLSDAAYGLIVMVACAIVLKKFPRMSESMNKALHMFMYCGVSTLIWGILFGGYFGDVIQVISRVFLGHEVEVPALWFVPLNNPMKLLLFAMLFGTIHLFVGLGIKGYMCLKDKKYLDFVCDVVFWYMMLIGLLIMLIPSDIFASIAQMEIVFPPAVSMLGKVLAIAGAVGILLMSGRSSKNPGVRIALGAYDLYNITGWLSDVLSYSRLLALGLATGVIASVVNQMGSMLGKSVFGVIVFIIVFVVGHVFNMAINLLGAYVHTNRLQFVEFFGKFYEGGGRAFHPFKANTKYVDVKEETSL